LALLFTQKAGHLAIKCVPLISSSSVLKQVKEEIKEEPVNLGSSGKLIKPAGTDVVEILNE